MQLENNLRLSLNIRKFSRGLFITCVALFVLNLIGVYFKIYQGWNKFITNGIYYFFNACEEKSAQTFFSAFLLVTAAAVVVLVGKMLEPKHPTRRYWFVLGGLFIFMALDETLTIHEQFNKLRPALNDQSGIFYFAWIIPYSILAIGAGVYFFRFLFLLPPATRNLFILSGAIFVGAAIGFEILEGYIVFNDGIGTHGDILLPPIEEFLEMSSITLFIYAALRHLKSLGKGIEMSIT
ncbi:MAG TPA: hypothetical protein PK339_08740 [Flavitalea sp.]|nr:hypothetical protein [Flavitalea sp.]